LEEIGIALVLRNAPMVAERAYDGTATLTLTAYPDLLAAFLYGNAEFSTQNAFF